MAGSKYGTQIAEDPIGSDPNIARASQAHAPLPVTDWKAWRAAKLQSIPAGFSFGVKAA